MKTLKEGIKLILDQQKFIDAEKEKLTKLMDELKKFCPVKVGDTVAVRGYYAFAGKPMRVEKIHLDVCFGRVDGFVVTGPVLKTDGTPSKNTARSDVPLPTTKERKNG